MESGAGKNGEFCSYLFQFRQGAQLQDPSVAAKNQTESKRTKETDVNVSLQTIEKTAANVVRFQRDP